MITKGQIETLISKAICDVALQATTDRELLVEAMKALEAMINAPSNVQNAAMNEVFDGDYEREQSRHFGRMFFAFQEQARATHDRIKQHLEG
jgi:hypothetical protein